MTIELATTMTIDGVERDIPADALTQSRVSDVRMIGEAPTTVNWKEIDALLSGEQCVESSLEADNKRPPEEWRKIFSERIYTLITRLNVLKRLEDIKVLRSHKPKTYFYA